MGILLGTNSLKGLYLGTQAVKKVYCGTDLVFSQAGSDVLFDNGWISGISWAGNLLPRPVYTSIASYSFGYVESDGYMQLSISSQSSYSNVNHNCHVCTSEAITVPAGATVMRVTVRQNLSGSPLMYLKFGLLTADCVDSMDDTNGGQLSSVLGLSGTAQATYDLTLNSGIAGNSFYAVVNARRTAQAAAARSMEIYKVWFE